MHVRVPPAEPVTYDPPYGGAATAAAFDDFEEEYPAFRRAPPKMQWPIKSKVKDGGATPT